MINSATTLSIAEKFNPFGKLIEVKSKYKSAEIQFHVWTIGYRNQNNVVELRKV